MTIKMKRFDINKIVSMLTLVLLVTATTNCSKDEPITFSVTDVSDRITGLSSNAPGQGAILTITGTQLNGVMRVAIGNEVVTKSNFVSQDESSITLVVPPNSALGENTLLVVWPGSARGTTTLEVVLFHTISSIAPSVAAVGQTVTLFGSNLNLVDEVAIGGVAATIISKTSTTLKFTMPAGATTGTVSINSSAGLYTSNTELIACESDPENLGCLPVINTNGSFEDGNSGDNNAPGWNLLGGSGGLHDAEITNEEAYEGNQSVKITVNDVNLGAGNQWHIQPTSTMNVNPTATYHLSLWVKGSGIANVKFAVDEGGNPGYTEWGNPEVGVSSGEWTQISYEFSPTSESGGDGVARFAVSMSYEGNAGGVLYMDNLRVVESGAGTEPTCAFEEDPICFCDEVPTDGNCTLLANGGFETGAGDDFTNWTKQNGGALMTATTESDEVVSGNRALKVTVDGSQGGDQQWRIQMISDAVTTEMDADYLIMVRAKAADEGGTIRFSTNASIGSGQQYQGDTAVPTDWTVIEWTITANSESTEVVLDLGGPFNTTYFIDDARIIKLP
jgi:hypothetical protein